jgi:hypothetical protein
VGDNEEHENMRFDRQHVLFILLIPASGHLTGLTHDHERFFPAAFLINMGAA